MRFTFLLCSLAFFCVTSAFSKNFAGTITGPSAVCMPANGSQYTVSGSSASTGYSWTIQGGVITAGAGTKTITVIWTNAGLGQNVTVSGNGLLTSYPVSVYAPINNATTISGPSAICPGAQGIAFSASGVATSVYSWGMPSGATIASGSGTSSISVNFSSSYSGGSIFAAGVSGPCGVGPYGSKSVANNLTPPASPGTVIGSTSVVQGQNGVGYSVPTIANATGYTWLLPNGASLASGANTNSISVNFNSSFTGGSIQVRGTNGACVGAASTPIFITLSTLPLAAGVITGNNSPCIGTSGTSITYSVPSITNATYYSWTLPPYAYIQGNGSLNSVTVFFPIQVASSGTISVQGMNSQGSGASSSMPLSFYRPIGLLGAISGEVSLCPNQVDVIYSVPVSINVSTYVWTVPSGASIVSGDNTNTITVNYATGFTSGNISVFGVGGCGRGPDSILPIALKLAPNLSHYVYNISGEPRFCPGESNVSYRIPQAEGATSYLWTTPVGSSIASGQGTNSILVNFSSNTPGTITVYAVNCAGTSESKSYQVSVRTPPAKAQLIYGSAEVCPGQSSYYYSINGIGWATGYNWTVPSGATIVSGQNTTEIEVNFSNSSSTGNISVSGTNCSVQGEVTELPVSVTGKIAAPNMEHSVNMVTGTVSAVLPLVTVSDGDIQIPVNLNYTGSGIKIKDSDGWLSHNWHLNAQSFGIFRDMRGLPDDYNGISPDNRSGWLNGSIANSVKNFNPTTDNNPATCTDEVSNYTFLNSISYDQDTEPDAFHVSLPGVSFDFYFDENKNPQVVPYSEVIISPNTTTGAISSFTIKDTNGVEYLFNETETLTEQVQTANQFYFVRKTNQQVAEFTYTTAWKLTKITSPLYGEINLTYDAQNINSDDLKPKVSTGSVYYSYFYNFPEIIKNGYGASNTTAYHRTSVQKLLRKISSPSKEVEFFSVDKYPGGLTKRLNSISVIDKRNGTELTDWIYFEYYMSSPRILLSSLTMKSSCKEATYNFLYNDYSLPGYNSEDVDEWGYYKVKTPFPGSLQYDESASATSLSKIIHPLKGFTAFFYETNDYWDGNTNKEGGGIRIKKIIQHDGISSLSDQISEYDYKSVEGNSSGVLHHQSALGFSVARQSNLYSGPPPSPRYREVQVTNPTSDINAMFTISGDRDLASPNFVMGSPVAYKRVTVKMDDAGKRVYEYKLWTPHGTISTTNGEWSASKVLIARPSTGNTYCFETPNIQEGYYRYPFPVNPNYSFANVELSKVSDYDHGDVLIKEISYSYKRVYKNETIRNIFGLALEELPTYYFNGSSYVDGKMFLYSKYTLLTAVKTELGTVTETIYHTSNRLVKNESAIEYFYDSPNHRQLSKTVKTNSDGSEHIDEFKYTKDYAIPTPVGNEAIAIKNLQDANRLFIVEVVKSKKRAGAVSIIKADLTLFNTIAGKVYPKSNYSFNAVDGSSSFESAHILNSEFKYDNSNYVLNNSILSYDNYGNITETMAKDRTVSSVAYGYNGTRPIIYISNAKLDEVKFSNFETPVSVDFTLNVSPTLVTSTARSTILKLPAGSITSNTLTHTFNSRKAAVYVFSVWIKAQSGGIFNIYVGGTSSGTTTFSFEANNWKFYTINIPVESIVGSSSFDLKIWSSVPIDIDDVAFHPLQSSFKAFSYNSVHYEKTSETDARGNTVFYEYDRSGRVSAIYDRDRNLIKTFTYHVKQ